MRYNYSLGIRVNGIPLPDPSSWSYEIADIDLGSGRDTMGYMHRDRIAVKVNYSFEWSVLGWKELQKILEAIKYPDFTLYAPDPKTFNHTRSGKYYVGNRSGETHFYDATRPEVAMFSLQLKFVEY